MKLLFLILTLFVSTIGLTQKHEEHGELPDFISNDSKLRYLSTNDTYAHNYKVQLKKIVKGEITIQTDVEAFAESNFKLDDDEYLLLTEIVSCPKNRRRDYKFTLYDPRIKKQWSFYIQEHEELRALFKYRQRLKDVIGDPSDAPVSRTGSETINERIKSLFSKKNSADKKLFIYYNENDFLIDSSQYIGDFVKYYKNKIIYTTNTGEEQTLKLQDFYRCKLDGKVFIPIFFKNYFTMITPIGFRQKYFYIDAGTILNVIETSEEAHYFGTVPNQNYVHYVSDSETSEIYKFHDLEEENSDDWQVIFECINKIESTDKQALIDREIECVKQFLLEEE